MIVFEIPHITRSTLAGWECVGCGTGSSEGDLYQDRWDHEERHQGVTVELPLNHPRVESYIDWISEIEDSEIEAAEEIVRERGWQQEDEGPEAGHRFMISFSSAGSYGVVGEPGHRDADWWSDDRSVTVRAWNLSDALRKAADLPLVAWFPDEEDPFGCPNGTHQGVDCPGDQCRYAVEAD